MNFTVKNVEKFFNDHPRILGKEEVIKDAKVITNKWGIIECDPKLLFGSRHAKTFQQEMELDFGHQTILYESEVVMRLALEKERVMTSISSKGKSKRKQTGRIKPDEGKTTFKPLKGGRLRCNQTGVIVTAGQVEAYRRSRNMSFLGQMQNRRGICNCQKQPHGVTEWDCPKHGSMPRATKRATRCSGKRRKYQHK